MGREGGGGQGRRREEKKEVSKWVLKLSSLFQGSLHETAIVSDTQREMI